MSVALEAIGQRVTQRDLQNRGVDLLSQQIWCWGCDILREEGNWLVEVGFQRLEPPADRENCSSVYSLELPPGRRVVLRGFGVFYGDDRLGGVFLKRYEFRPRYTAQAALECPPWTDADLPKLRAPNESQREACAALTLDLIDWIRSYEETLAQRLGTEYRQSTLDKWTNAKGPALPAEEMAGAWQSLGATAAENVPALVPQR